MPLAAALLAAACDGPSPGRGSPAPASGEPSASAREVPPPSPERPAPERPAPERPAPPSAPREASSGAPRAASPARSAAGCRVVTLSGSATLGGEPLAAGALLGGGALAGAPLELAAGARLGLVHASSARAWSLEGPARLFACAGGAEELVLARGTLRAEPGTGARPGAEVWVGTPFGALRYADAAATLSVGERQLAVRVATGRVWFTPLGGSEPEERAVAAAATFSAAPYRLSEGLALERCRRDASAADERARAVLAPSPRPLGERAAEHVRARERAHASCASARAAALASGGSEATAGAELARYDALWRSVPRRAAALPP